ncbi:uncharacterized protein LOC141910794 [Tubulanus polymorphus]|uniref:uncharacterized protein LOC141910794 n=1 Tax=Tubulanus polymorphus TaxID=672921 RepID=UPI003DA518E6
MYPLPRHLAGQHPTHPAAVAAAVSMSQMPGLLEMSKQRHHAAATPVGPPPPHSANDVMRMQIYNDAAMRYFESLKRIHEERVKMQTGKSAETMTLGQMSQLQQRHLHQQKIQQHHQEQQQKQHQQQQAALTSQLPRVVAPGGASRSQSTKGDRKDRPEGFQPLDLSLGLKLVGRETESPLDLTIRTTKRSADTTAEVNIDLLNKQLESPKIQPHKLLNVDITDGSHQRNLKKEKLLAAAYHDRVYGTSPAGYPLIDTTQIEAQIQARNAAHYYKQLQQQTNLQQHSKQQQQQSEGSSAAAAAAAAAAAYQSQLARHYSSQYPQLSPQMASAVYSHAHAQYYSPSAGSMAAYLQQQQRSQQKQQRDDVIRDVKPIISPSGKLLYPPVSPHSQSTSTNNSTSSGSSGLQAKTSSASFSDRERALAAHYNNMNRSRTSREYPYPAGNGLLRPESTDRRKAPNTGYYPGVKPLHSPAQPLSGHLPPHNLDAKLSNEPHSKSVHHQPSSQQTATSATASTTTLTTKPSSNRTDLLPPQPTMIPDHSIIAERLVNNKIASSTSKPISSDSSSSAEALRAAPLYPLHLAAIPDNYMLTPRIDTHNEIMNRIRMYLVAGQEHKMIQSLGNLPTSSELSTSSSRALSSIREPGQILRTGSPQMPVLSPHRKSPSGGDTVDPIRVDLPPKLTRGCFQQDRLNSTNRFLFNVKHQSAAGGSTVASSGVGGKTHGLSPKMKLKRENRETNSERNSPALESTPRSSISQTDQQHLSSSVSVSAAAAAVDTAGLSGLPDGPIIDPKITFISCIQNSIHDTLLSGIADDQSMPSTLNLNRVVKTPEVITISDSGSEKSDRDGRRPNNKENSVDETSSKNNDPKLNLSDNELRRSLIETSGTRTSSPKPSASAPISRVGTPTELSRLGLKSTTGFQKNSQNLSLPSSPVTKGFKRKTEVESGSLCRASFAGTDEENIQQPQRKLSRLDPAAAVAPASRNICNKSTTAKRKRTDEDGSTDDQNSSSESDSKLSAGKRGVTGAKKNKTSTKEAPPRDNENQPENNDVNFTGDEASPSGRRAVPPLMRRMVVNKNSGETVLHRAARLSYEDVALYCLETGHVDVNIRDNAGYTPLHECALRGHIQVAIHLINFGADVNCSASDGTRPIHDAVDNNRIEFVRLLLSYGADPLLATYGGKTPLSIARTSCMKAFLRGFLKDINGSSDAAAAGDAGVADDDDEWSFYGSRCLDADDEDIGCNLFDNLPPDDEDADLHIQIELSSRPQITSYVLHLPGDTRPRHYVMLNHVIGQLQLTKAEFVNKHGDVDLRRVSATIFRKQVQESVVTELPECISQIGKRGPSYFDVVPLDSVAGNLIDGALIRLNARTDCEYDRLRFGSDTQLSMTSSTKRFSATKRRFSQDSTVSTDSKGSNCKKKLKCSVAKGIVYEDDWESPDKKKLSRPVRPGIEPGRGSDGAGYDSSTGAITDSVLANLSSSSSETIVGCGDNDTAEIDSVNNKSDAASLPGNGSKQAACVNSRNGDVQPDKTINITTAATKQNNVESPAIAKTINNQPERPTSGQTIHYHATVNDRQTKIQSSPSSAAAVNIDLINNVRLPINNLYMNRFYGATSQQRQRQQQQHQVQTKFHHPSSIHHRFSSPVSGAAVSASPSSFQFYTQQIKYQQQPQRPLYRGHTASQPMPTYHHNSHVMSRLHSSAGSSTSGGSGLTAAQLSRLPISTGNKNASNKKVTVSTSAAETTTTATTASHMTLTASDPVVRVDGQQQQQQSVSDNSPSVTSKSTSHDNDAIDDQGTDKQVEEDCNFNQVGYSLTTGKQQPNNNNNNNNNNSAITDSLTTTTTTTTSTTTAPPREETTNNELNTPCTNRPIQNSSTSREYQDYSNCQPL